MPKEHGRHPDRLVAAHLGLRALLLFTVDHPRHQHCEAHSLRATFRVDAAVSYDAASAARREREDHEAKDIKARTGGDQSTGHGEDEGPEYVEDDTDLGAQQSRIVKHLR